MFPQPESLGVSNALATSNARALEVLNITLVKPHCHTLPHTATNYDTLSISSTLNHIFSSQHSFATNGKPVSCCLSLGDKCHTHDMSVTFGAQYQRLHDHVTTFIETTFVESTDKSSES